MLPNSILAAAAAALVFAGLAVLPRSFRPVVDAIAQTLSLMIAYRLLSTGWGGDESGAVLLVFLAGAVASSYALGVSQKSRVWAYIDGANFGAWGTLILWGIVNDVKEPIPVKNWKDKEEAHEVYEGLDAGYLSVEF